jgi:hypothetical protein
MCEFSNELGALAAALAKVQGALKPAVKDATNPHLKNRYADLSSCWQAAQELLAANGLAVIQTGEVDGDGRQYLATILVHESGQWIKGRLYVPAEEQRGTNAAQQLGSALTYVRRYGLCALLGITTEDDDGASAGAPSQRQAASSNGHDAPADLCLQFKQKPSPEQKKALMDAGYTWNGEMCRWQAARTEGALTLGRAALDNCAAQIKWHRGFDEEPEPAPAGAPGGDFDHEADQAGLWGPNAEQ